MKYTRSGKARRKCVKNNHPDQTEQTKNDVNRRSTKSTSARREIRTKRRKGRAAKATKMIRLRATGGSRTSYTSSRQYLRSCRRDARWAEIRADSRTRDLPDSGKMRGEAIARSKPWTVHRISPDLVTAESNSAIEASRHRPPIFDRSFDSPPASPYVHSRLNFVSVKDVTRVS